MVDQKALLNLTLRRYNKTWQGLYANVGEICKHEKARRTLTVDIQNPDMVSERSSLYSREEYFTLTHTKIVSFLEEINVSDNRGSVESAGAYYVFKQESRVQHSIYSLHWCIKPCWAMLVGIFTLLN